MWQESLQGVSTSFVLHLVCMNLARLWVVFTDFYSNKEGDIKKDKQKQWKHISNKIKSWSEKRQNNTWGQSKAAHLLQCYWTSQVVHKV